MTAPLLRQIWTMSAVLICMFGQALVLSYPCSLLPALHHPDSSIKIDLNTGSWLGSIVGIAGIPGFILSSYLMDRWGRRISHGMLILPGILGWLFIYFANDVPTLMIGRFLGGLSATATVSLGAIVIGEYTSPKHRGVFLYLKNATVCLGAMCTHVSSRYLHWRTIALVSQIPFFVALMIIYMWPESPAWLISKQQYKKSETAFLWLRGTSNDSRRELEETIKAQKIRMAEPKLKLSFNDKIFNFFKKFTQKDFLKPCAIAVLASLVLEMSGRHVFPAYALVIMTEITGETSDSFYYTLVIDLIITASATFASILAKWMNRRTLLFSTGFSAFVVLMTVCSYLALAAKGVISSDRTLIPISLLVLYFILANLGCSPIPLALVGEVFPLAHRGAGSGISGVWISICLMIGLKSTPHLLVSVKVYGFFAVYGVIMGASLLILYFLLPETKDRTLQEIENYFQFGKFRNDEKSDDEAKTKMISV